MADAVVLPSERVDALDPPPGLRALAEQAPISRLRFSDGQAGWLVTSYALGRALLVDNRFSVDLVAMPLGDAEMIAEIDRVEKSTPESAGVLILLHPPQHTKIRRAAAKYFTVRAVRRAAAGGRADRRRPSRRDGAGGRPGRPGDGVRAASLVVLDLRDARRPAQRPRALRASERGARRSPSRRRAEARGARRLLRLLPSGRGREAHVAARGHPQRPRARGRAERGRDRRPRAAAVRGRARDDRRPDLARRRDAAARPRALGAAAGRSGGKSRTRSRSCCATSRSCRWARSRGRRRRTPSWAAS